MCNSGCIFPQIHFKMYLMKLDFATACHIFEYYLYSSIPQCPNIGLQALTQPLGQTPRAVCCSPRRGPLLNICIGAVCSAHLSLCSLETWYVNLDGAGAATGAGCSVVTWVKRCLSSRSSDLGQRQSGLSRQFLGDSPVPGNASHTLTT